MSEWFALPVLSDNALSLNIILLDELLDGYASAAGMPNPRPTAILCGEFQRCVAESGFADGPSSACGSNAIFNPPTHPEAGPHSRKLRRRSSRGKERKYINPEARSTSSTAISLRRSINPVRKTGPMGEQYEHTLGAISDRPMAFPIAQNGVLRSSVWRKDDSMDAHVRAFGFATSGAASFILHVEYEKQDSLLKVIPLSAGGTELTPSQIASDAGIQKILAEAVQDLNLVEASYFGADVITLVERN
ncbi:hypothetical protein B0H13DRAFT_1863062 [Mycena leptocephala]|nr:hypothetical protein B0H13DRAFT_1863062 [Mycena leptocephala]